MLRRRVWCGGDLRTLWTHTLAAYLVPTSGGNPWWKVCGSSMLGSASVTEGHMTALPLTAGTITPRLSKRVPPPASGVDRYMKKV